MAASYPVFTMWHNYRFTTSAERRRCASPRATFASSPGAWRCRPSGVPPTWAPAWPAAIGPAGRLKDVTLQVNVTNLFDKRHFGTIGSNGFSASDPQGTSMTLMAGAPRQVFFTLSGKL